MGRVVYYVAVSADGFIADKEGGVSWLEGFDSRELGYESFVARVGAVVMGRLTYEQALGFGPWPYAGKRALVVTSRAIPDLPADTATVTAAELPAALAELRAGTTGDIWLVGGAQTARVCLDRGLLDELELYVIPRLLGEGIPLVAPRAHEVPLGVLRSRAFPNGVQMVTYAVER